jgi:formylglycine-generating enzyme required for sulfatase activity
MPTPPTELNSCTTIEMKFAWIPPGRFLMGNDKGESDEKPMHRVTITRGFWMGIYPVTQSQFEAVLSYNPSQFKGNNDSSLHPVEMVNWSDAKEFCQEFSKLTERPIRLPTEAEWEYACRAGSNTDYWSGSGEAPLKRVAWYGGTAGTSKGQTQPVGKLDKNSWGLFDVHGNVWEWCEDPISGYSAEDDVDPLSLSGLGRVLRGGAWNSNADACRAAFRNWKDSATRSASFGFRVCFRLD